MPSSAASLTMLTRGSYSEIWTPLAIWASFGWRKLLDLFRTDGWGFIKEIGVFSQPPSLWTSWRSGCKDTGPMNN